MKRIIFGAVFLLLCFALTIVGTVCLIIFYNIDIVYEILFVFGCGGIGVGIGGFLTIIGLLLIANGIEQ